MGMTEGEAENGGANARDDQSAPLRRSSNVKLAKRSTSFSGVMSSFHGISSMRRLCGNSGKAPPGVAFFPSALTSPAQDTSQRCPGVLHLDANPLGRRIELERAYRDVGATQRLRLRLQQVDDVRQLDADVESRLCSGAR